MSEEGDRLRKRFNDLAKQAQEFFEEVGVEPGNARHIADHTWALLSVEQQATADRIRRDLRKLLTLLVPEIQSAPLLDKRDLPRFAKLGRTMDAALRFESFRRNDVGNLACDVFREAYDEARELLELLPRQGPWQPAVAAKSLFSKLRK
jgi:hypothetical protein